MERKLRLTAVISLVIAVAAAALSAVFLANALSGYGKEIKPLSAVSPAPKRITSSVLPSLRRVWVICNSLKRRVKRAAAA